MHVSIRSLSVGAAAALLAAIITAFAPSTSIASTNAMNIAFTDDYGCGGCDSCDDDEVEGHIFDRNDEIGRAKGGSMGSHECDPGKCDDEHPYSTSCPKDGPALALMPLPELWQTLHRASGDELEVVLAQHAAVVHVNTERKAFQLLTCDGSVVAHLPMTSEQAESLVRHGS